MKSFVSIFEDVFLFPWLFNDNYNKDIVEYLDRRIYRKPYDYEGPYGYTDQNFDVTVKKMMW
jgi:hypothetical protein